MDIRNMVHKPFVESECSLHLDRLSKQMRGKVKRAILNGFIDVYRGDSHAVFTAICQLHNLPEISVPTRGYSAEDISVHWHNSDKPQLLLDKLEEIFTAEQVAAKMIHGHNNKSHDYRVSGRQEPRRNLYQYSANYNFKNTKPDWGEIIRECIAATPWWQERINAAMATFNSGKVSFRYNG
jgi:hypothetical protein